MRSPSQDSYVYQLYFYYYRTCSRTDTGFDAQSARRIYRGDAPAAEESKGGEEKRKYVEEKGEKGTLAHVWREGGRVPREGSHYSSGAPTSIAGAPRGGEGETGQPNEIEGVHHCCGTVRHAGEGGRWDWLIKNYLPIEDM